MLDDELGGGRVANFFRLAYHAGVYEAYARRLARRSRRPSVAVIP